MADHAEHMLNNMDDWDPQQIRRREWTRMELLVRYLMRELPHRRHTRSEMIGPVDEVREVMPYLLRYIHSITNPRYDWWKDVLSQLYFRAEDVLVLFEEVYRYQRERRG